MKYIISIVMTFVLVYLLFAFCMWDINAGHWDALTRSFCAFLSAILSPFLPIGIILIKDHMP